MQICSSESHLKLELTVLGSVRSTLDFFSCFFFYIWKCPVLNSILLDLAASLFPFGTSKVACGLKNLTHPSVIDTEWIFISGWTVPFKHCGCENYHAKWLCFSSLSGWNVTVSACKMGLHMQLNSTSPTSTGKQMLINADTLYSLRRTRLHTYCLCLFNADVINSQLKVLQRCFKLSNLSLYRN